ncbi:hypothetical protein OG250_07270 [Streptomyces sp. NBC_00487]|uniref:hypothetical protein n=1 Tax=unclassified Streptomyces TaxID=2593676 RepID=UPI002DDB5ACA|nr:MULTISPECIES: hypothetical protein [unclassified Streptomyces]WRY94704.1 hypothetical protein OG889_08225 [Streptomyces sp. NBC_00481]
MDETAKLTARTYDATTVLYEAGEKAGFRPEFKVSREAEPGAQATCEVYCREPGEDRPAPESCSAGS